MDISGKLRRWKNAVTASDVVNEYNSRIDAFVRSLEGRAFITLEGEGDKLQNLFRWGQHISNEKASLDQRLSRLNLNFQSEHTDRKAAEKRNDQLTKELQELSAKIESLETLYTQNINEIQKEHVDETDRLKGQLLVNVDKAKTWPDDRIKLRFKELKSKIEAMTSPSRLKLLREQQVHLHFDSSGFLYRAGNSNVRFLVRSIIWSILYEHFFALPFGFGVLGPASEKNTLLKAFEFWYTAVHGSKAKSKTN
jgi:chromosome segregation ATPase